MKTGEHIVCWSASRKGRLHCRIGLPNQDACTCRVWGNRALCVVADGVGSAGKSQEGARMICQLAVEMFSRLTPDIPVDNDLLELLRQRWVKRLGAGEVREYSTTCRLVYVTPQLVYVANVGDGGTMLLTKDACVACMSCERDDGFINQTEALSTMAMEWTIAVYPTDSIMAIFAMTDGIYEDIAETLRPDFARELYRWTKKLSARKACREMRKVLRRWCGSADDKTIVTIVRKESYYGI